MKTLEDLENIVIRRTKEKFEQELNNPSETWKRTLVIYLGEDAIDSYEEEDSSEAIDEDGDIEDYEEYHYSQIIDKLTASFIYKFNKVITGHFRDSDYLDIYDCSIEDVISLKNEFLSKNFDKKNLSLIEQVTKKVTIDLFNRYVERKDFNSILEYIIDDLYFFSLSKKIYSISHKLIESNLDKLYLLLGESEDISEEESYDEGFDELEESMKKTKTLKDLENKVIQRTKEKFEQELNNPSEIWFNTMFAYLSDGIDWEEKSYFVERLARTFLLKFRRNILYGVQDNATDISGILALYDCTSEDVISLAEQFISEELPKNENLDPKGVKATFTKNIRYKWFDSVLWDILFYSEFTSRENLTPIVYDLVDKNFQRILDCYQKEVKKEYSDDYDEDYDEGFGELEESMTPSKKTVGKRVRWR